MTVDPAVPRTLGLRPGMRALVLNAPAGCVESLRAAVPGTTIEEPARESSAPGAASPAGSIDWIHVFCGTSVGPRCALRQLEEVGR